MRLRISSADRAKDDQSFIRILIFNKLYLCEDFLQLLDLLLITHEILLQIRPVGSIDGGFIYQPFLPWSICRMAYLHSRKALRTTAGKASNTASSVIIS